MDLILETCDRNTAFKHEEGKISETWIVRSSGLFECFRCSARLFLNSLVNSFVLINKLKGGRKEAMTINDFTIIAKY
jgi:hypothetical protein